MNKSKLISLISLLFGISILSYGKAYKGAEYRTHDTFLYGRFEVSMKPANRVGVISSFFTYHEISTTTDWNEIDIENIGCYDDIIQFNTITSGQVGHVRNEPVKFNQYEEFHTYAFEWTPKPQNPKGMNYYLKMNNSNKAENQENGSEGEEDPNDFFNLDKREIMRKKKQGEQKYNEFYHFLLYLARVAHITTAMLTCSLIIINCIFDNISKQVPLLNTKEALKIAN